MQREEMLQHSGRESEAKCESDSPLSLSPSLSPGFTFHFHSLLLPLSALKQLPPLMQGTFQITAGGGSRGLEGGSAGGAGCVSMERGVIQKVL